MKAVVFDMDGVLFDTERLCMETWREVAAEEGIKDIEPAVQGCIGLNRTDTRRFFLDYYGENFPYEQFRSLTAERMQKKMEDGIPLMPGVKELLSYLTKQKVSIGLASSTSRERVLFYLRQTGLERYFEVVVGGDMITHSKPLPDIYLLACEKLGIIPEECFAIEDSLNGIRSAYSAGMQAIMVPDMVAPTPEAEEKSTVILPSLFAVQEWFEEKNSFSCVHAL